MPTRLLLIAAGLVLATGCFGGVNAKNWNKKSSKDFCKYQKRCTASEFYFNFNDVGECAEAQELMLMSLDGYYVDCTFQKENAKLCLDGLNSSCKQLGVEFDLLIAPCYQVWDCPTDYTLGGSGAGGIAPL